ncbi:nose resistant to fluoxetine protein 6 [Lucilia cuprina]|uniref:nose resistant to fluoxetine protein 6 n=1 Tax=Lucilia cuprina TaxID=7375 RepID=UPI001F06BF71|nr:nose resistant to fluoxetine protein 6 [Lucilia cuprina]
MMLKYILWFISIMPMFGIIVQGFEMNMTQYYKMPSLYDLDDYDRCLQEFNDFSMYCFVRADVIPQRDNNNEAWQAIEEISMYYKHHFQHRHLYYGICVQWCQLEIDKLAKDEANDLFKGVLMNNTKVNVYLNLFKSEDGNRQRYNHLLNQCVNMRLKKYNLSAESVVEYCESSNRIVEQDFWNLTFYAAIGVLILFATASSLFDLYLKHKRKDKLLTDRDHYKASPGNLACKICVSFSIARNWYRLNQEPNGKIGRELRFLDCFKFFSMFLVIFAHTNWVLYEGAISNPQDPERLLHTLAGTLLVAGSLITVTFFVISGLLLTINWLVVAKQNEELSTLQYISLFIKFNVFRYLRLTIPYAFVILWSGIYFDNAGGPLWRHILEREQLSCRKNWWANLLYLNNYINTNERCMLQGWYLASDTQSFVLSLVFLMMAHKWRKARNWILGIIFAIFMILPGIMTYVKEFNAIFIPTPQIQRDSFVESRQFNEFYVPFHMNFACYFCGVLAALIYDHVSTKQIKLRQNKWFHAFFYSLIVTGILWMFTGHTFLQQYHDEDMRLWNSLYAAIQRNVWGMGLGVFIVGMSSKCGWIFRKFCCLPIFRILGRLTYGAFMVHLLISRVVIATLREPIYFGTGMMFAFIVFTMSASYVVSFVLAILLELPVSSFLKLLR